MPIRIYIAGSLFAMGERMWNSWLATELRCRGFDVWLPQEEAAVAVHSEGVDHKRVFHLCLEGLEKSDVVVALFEGADVDSGTSFECGYAFHLGRPILGIRTDLRSGGEEDGVNTMLRRCCKGFISVSAFDSRDKLIPALVDGLEFLGFIPEQPGS